MIMAVISLSMAVIFQVHGSYLSVHGSYRLALYEGLMSYTIHEFISFAQPQYHASYIQSAPEKRICTFYFVKSFGEKYHP